MIINKDYILAYEKYLEILNKNSSQNIYNSLISLHGAYNLVDYISEILLSYKSKINKR